VRLLLRQRFRQCSEPAHPPSHAAAGQPAAGPDYEFNALGTTRCREQGVFLVDLCQLPSQRMPAGRAEEMVVVEVDADQSDARGSHVAREIDRDVRRVVGVI
jgi:hypothetical protein